MTDDRMTLEDYDDMVAAGMFDGKRHRRVEFIRGEIREMSPIGPEHDRAVSWLTRWSIENLPRSEGEVRIQSSLLRHQCVEVHRDPAAGHYASLQTVAGDEEVSPLCRPLATLRPRELFSSDVN